jgi:signal peptidase I
LSKEHDILLLRLSEAKQHGNFCAVGQLRRNLRAESECAPPLDGATRAQKKNVVLLRYTKTCAPETVAYNAPMSDTGKGLLKDLFTLAFLIIVVVIPIRVFIISPFVVDGESMHPTFENLDYLVIDELIYDFQSPARGDVIVFRYPGNPSVFYIKRVIGLPGETVSIDRGIVSITKVDGSNITLGEPYIVNEDATYTKKVSLRAGEYFVMGDNRPNSSDSRVWGVLPKKNIIGRVDLRLLPVSKASFFPGAATYTDSATTTIPATL